MPRERAGEGRNSRSRERHAVSAISRPCAVSPPVGVGARLLWLSAPGVGRTCPASTLSEPFSANTAFAASLARPSGSVSRHNPAPFLPPGPCYFKNSSEKMCTGEVQVGAGWATRETGRHRWPGCKHICPLKVSPALLIAGVG